MIDTIESIDLTSLSKESADALVKLKGFALEIDQDDLEDIDIMYREATANMIVKLTKDFEVMVNVNKPDDYVLPMTNRSNVSYLNSSLLILSGAVLCVPEVH